MTYAIRSRIHLLLQAARIGGCAVSRRTQASQPLPLNPDAVPLELILRTTSRIVSKPSAALLPPSASRPRAQSAVVGDDQSFIARCVSL